MVTLPSDWDYPRAHHRLFLISGASFSVSWAPSPALNSGLMWAFACDCIPLLKACFYQKIKSKSIGKNNHHKGMDSPDSRSLRTHMWSRRNNTCASESSSHALFSLRRPLCLCRPTWLVLVKDQLGYHLLWKVFPFPPAWDSHYWLSALPTAFIWTFTSLCDN